MAFQTDGLAKIYSEIQEKMIRLKGEATQMVDTINNLGGSTLSAEYITNTFIRLGSYYNDFEVAAATPGLVKYAKAEQDDQSYDVVAEFQNVQATINTVLNWIYANFPKSPSPDEYLLKDQFDITTGAVITRRFNQAQLSGLVTQLNLLIAAID